MPLQTEWLPEECSKIVKRDALLEEHIKEQCIDSIRKEGLTFPLYYFVKDLTFENEEKPTVLFAAGGPGQMVLATAGENFVDMVGYRVVYFHLRGTGFSQLPKDLIFDQFLRTDYVAHDIEAIREELLGEHPWSAVIGHSYGAVVAQYYAHHFCEKVNKVVLSAPVMPLPYMPRKAGTKKATIGLRPLDNLRNIYKRDQFVFLDEISVANKKGKSTRDLIVDRGEEVVKRVESLHWNIPFVSEEYTRLEPQLAKHGLDFGAAFYIAVRRLRLCGWLPISVPLARGSDTKVDDTQRDSALIIADALMRKFNPPMNLEAQLKKLIDRASDEKKTALNRQLDFLSFANQKPLIKNSQNTARSYYVISLYDGLNEKFQKELAVHKKVKKALHSIGGQGGFNPSLEKAAICLTTPPKPWDPAKKSHSVPTLIIKGGADPLTELGEAEYYFKHGLKGEKALIEFRGVGHSMALPRLLRTDPKINEVSYKINGEVKQYPLEPREALIDRFIKKSHAEFKRAAIFEALDNAFLDASDETGRPRGRPEPVKKRFEP